MIKLFCYSCQTELQFSDKVGFREECPTCRSDVHVCKNCDFFDPKVYNECRETSAEVVRERDRANYCEYFQPKAGSDGGLSKADQLKAAAEALFKKS